MPLGHVYPQKNSVIKMVSIMEGSTGRPLPTWDPEQQAVVMAPPEARIVVTAGPGTGKTAVACGRVAHLITEQDVEPSCIMLLSFTRTAVAEIRSRIATYVGSESRAAGIKIATLDSTTWSLLSGLDPDTENLLGGYDANIDRLCRMVSDGEDEVLDYLEQIEQLVIDEAQDVLGNRAELVAQIIRHLPATCGVTVLADACQSIYGFTHEDGEKTGNSLKSLLDLLPTNEMRGDFRSLRLTRLHRTSEQSLVKLLKATRPIVEAAETDNPAHYRQLRETILNTAPRIEVDRAGLADVARGRNNMMVLYRTRAEALLTASMLLDGGVQHRLRLSGLPAWLHPWIAVLLSDFSADLIDETTFFRLWRERKCDALPGSPPPAAAWQSSLGVANERGRLRVGRLRQVLSVARPPIEFCAVDNGFTGPVIGTVHASKGREADDVLLFLPQAREDAGAWDEEARVLYVGVTRARKQTSVAQGGATYSRFLEDACRPVRLQPNAGKAQFEVGRIGDLDEFSVVSSKLHRDASSVVTQQQRLAQSAAVTEKWILRKEREWNWAYRLMEEGGDDSTFGEMSQAFGGNVHAIARSLGANSPMAIRHIRKVGVRTFAVSPDSVRLNELVSPYSETGFFLVPVIRAWTMTWFPRGRR